MKLLVSVLLCAIACASIYAETSEEVVESYFKKIQSVGMHEIAPMIHPEELREFRQQMQPMIEAALAGAKNKQPLAAFASEKDPTKLRSMGDQEFFRQFMLMMTKAKPGANQIAKDADIEALGHVDEGDVQHVVVRTKVRIGGVEAIRMVVVSVKPFEGKIKLLLSGDIKQVAQSMKGK